MIITIAHAGAAAAVATPSLYGCSSALPLCASPHHLQHPRRICHQPLLTAASAGDEDPGGIPNPFIEPGGEYELDMDEVGQMVRQYEAAEQRWRTVAVTTGENMRKRGPLDDPGSMLHKWWHDPMDGPQAKAERYQRNIQLKRRFNLVARPSLIALGVGAVR